MADVQGVDPRIYGQFAAQEAQQAKLQQDAAAERALAQARQAQAQRDQADLALKYAQAPDQHQKALDEHQKSVLDSLKAEAEVGKTRSERGLQLWRIAQATGSPGAYAAGRRYFIQDAEDEQAIPPTMPDPETFDKMIDTSVSVKDLWEHNEKAVDHFVKGDTQKGLAYGILGSAHDPDALQEFLQHAPSLGASPALVQSLGQMPPEQLQQWAQTQLAAGKDKPASAEAKVGTFEDYVTRTYGANPTPTQVIKARQEWARSDDAPGGGTSEPLVDVIGPDGKRVLVPRSQAVGKTPGAAGTASSKPATGAQNKVLGFFNRAKQADDDLQKLEPAIAKLGFSDQARMSYGYNWMQSQLGQSYNQAQRAFTEARLRKDSGAAIPNTEFENDRRTYFAQPGDSAATLAQKARARAAVLASLGYESGPALSGFYGDDDAGSMIADFKQRAASATGDIQVTAPNGKVYTFPNQAQADVFKKRAGIK